jgi:hypothetical protein
MTDLTLARHRSRPSRSPKVSKWATDKLHMLVDHCLVFSWFFSPFLLAVSKHLRIFRFLAPFFSARWISASPQVFFTVSSLQFLLVLFCYSSRFCRTKAWAMTGTLPFIRGQGESRARSPGCMNCHRREKGLRFRPATELTESRGFVSRPAAQKVQGFSASPIRYRAVFLFGIRWKSVVCPCPCTELTCCTHVHSPVHRRTHIGLKAPVESLRVRVI